MSSSGRNVFSAGSERHTGKTLSAVSLGFLAIVLGAISSWQSPAWGQDSCSGKEKIKISCKIHGDFVKKTTVKLKKGQSNTTYICKLDRGQERKESTNGKGKAKFTFKFPRNNRPRCGSKNTARVGVNERGGFQECVSRDFICECGVPCQTMDVSGFIAQDELNLRYTRQGEVLWTTDTTKIEWDGNARWQGHRNDAGRVAFCDAVNGDPGDGPWDCKVWKEWQGGGRWVVVNAKFECLD